MNPFLPLSWLLWGAVTALLGGEALGWYARLRRRGTSRWKRRLHWVALLLFVMAVLWFGVVALDFMRFVQA